MGAFRESEWMVAQGDLQQAREEFADAEAHLDSGAGSSTSSPRRVRGVEHEGELAEQAATAHTGRSRLL